MKNNKAFVALILCAMLALTGCSSTGAAKDFSGLSTPDGSPLAHLSTTNIALHGMFGKTPLSGNATLEKTVADFTAEAKSLGASKVRIVQSSKVALWFIMPPISFFLTPVITNVAGEAIQ